MSPVKVGDLVKHKHYNDLKVGIITRKPNHMFFGVYWLGDVTCRLEQDGDLEMVNEAR